MRPSLKGARHVLWLVGEGAGAVVLKRLDVAQADQESIYAVIEAIDLTHQATFQATSIPTPTRPSAETVRRACETAFTEAGVQAADIGEQAVLHCWTGGSKWTKRFDTLGVTFSLAGPLTYKTGETLQHAARFLPRDRTMVETDSPYLTPEPLRGRPNEPAFVVHTGVKLAEIWDVEVDDVARLTTETAARVFGPPRG